MSKLATPTPAIDVDILHVIDDASSAMHDCRGIVTVDVLVEGLSRGAIATRLS